MMTDKTLTCKNCGNQFVWTAAEQEFYQSRGLQNPPGRCKDCRELRRAEGGGGRSSSSSYGGPRQMYSATCSNCGKEAQVPFQPRGDKPVYCSDCYQPQRTGGRSNDRGSDRRSRW